MVSSADIDELELGEDLEGSAVMFADISGFSKLAERLHALGSADDFLSTSNSNAAGEQNV